jgi:hypothetical protein
MVPASCPVKQGDASYEEQPMVIGVSVIGDR